MGNYKSAREKSQNNSINGAMLITMNRVIMTINKTPTSLYYRIFRISRPEVFCKKVVSKNFAKVTGKHLCQSFIFNKKETLEKVFPGKV